MKVNKWFLPIAGIILLFGVIGLAQITGYWVTNQRAESSTSSVSTTPTSPADGSADITITGQTTLRQIIDATGIPLATLLAEAGLPADTDPEATLRSLKDLVPGFEPSSVRDAVARLTNR